MEKQGREGAVFFSNPRKSENFRSSLEKLQMFALHNEKMEISISDGSSYDDP